MGDDHYPRAPYPNRLLPQGPVQPSLQQQYLGGAMGHQHFPPSHFPQRLPPNQPGQSLQSAPFGQPQQRPLHQLFHGHQQQYGLGPGFDNERRQPHGHSYGQIHSGPGAPGYSIPHGPSLGHGGYASHHAPPGHPAPHRGNLQQQYVAMHAQKMKQFWAEHTQDLIASGTHNQPPLDFQTHAFPLARIKKIMKSDDEVRVTYPVQHGRSTCGSPLTN